MVFGMNSIYFAIAVYLNSLISLIFVILFLSVIIIYLRLAEEKRLFKDFGIEYLEYKRNVSMIIPFLSKKTNNI
jgi:protein-S-isoprenylcysteine O-methyltransferase Ste14